MKKGILEVFWSLFLITLHAFRLLNVGRILTGRELSMLLKKLFFTERNFFTEKNIHENVKNIYLI